MITIERKQLSEVYKDLLPLFEEHHQEVSLDTERMKLHPKKEQYLLLEQTENLISLLVYEGEKIVGYSISVIVDHPHYLDFIIAQNEAIFIKKEYRGLSIGSQLLKATEEQAFSEGADYLTLGAKKGTDLETILPDRGYTVHDIIFSKVL